MIFVRIFVKEAKRPEIDFIGIGLRQLHDLSDELVSSQIARAFPVKEQCL